MRRKSLIFGLPIFLIGGTAIGIYSLDTYLFENPHIEKELIAKSEAYGEGLLDMSNPWGTFNPDDPAAFLMSFMVGADPDLKKRFREALAKVDPEKLERLAMMFNAMELSDAQRTKFANLLIVVMSSEKALQNISRVLDILERLGKFGSQVGVAGADLLSEASTLEQEEQLEGELPAEEVISEPILLGFLDIKDPNDLSNLMEALLELPEDIYHDLMSILPKVDPGDADFLAAFLKELSVSERKRFVNFIVKLAS